MIKLLVSFTILFVLSSARPQEIDSNQAAIANTEANEAPVIVNNDASMGNAVDFSFPTNVQVMNCLKKAKYQVVFLRGFVPTGNGAFDSNCVGNIRNAYSAGLGIETYMTPQPISSWQGYQQLDLLYNGLNNNGITIRSVWIQVSSSDTV